MSYDIVLDKLRGAFISSAIGDALGWPNEFNSKIKSKNETIEGIFVKWTRTSGGRYQSYDEVIMPGEYSDDTQLIISTARSLIIAKEKWNNFFTKNELPYWLEYERGGGAATKRSARIWKNNNFPWNPKNSIDDLKKYYNSGGNGVAMRVLPHVAVSGNKKSEDLIKDVIRNGMYTHGHPRAILGATCYAYALFLMLHQSETLKYGELVDKILMSSKIWGEFYNVTNSEEWIATANKYLDKDYFELWDYHKKAMCDKLLIVKEALASGAVDFTSKTLEKLGCFDKTINGAGDVTTISAIYLASKYAASPKIAIRETAFLKGTDTDTLATMVGGLVGIINGVDWIPYEWRYVQDYNCLYMLPELLLDIKSMDSVLDNKFENSDNRYLSSPIGRIQIVTKWNNNVNVKNVEVTTTKAIDEFGQTIYIKKISKKQLKSKETKEEDVINITNIKQQLTFLHTENKIFKLSKSEIESIVENLNNKILFKTVLKIIVDLMDEKEDIERIIKRYRVKKEIVLTLKKNISSN